MAHEENVLRTGEKLTTGQCLRSKSGLYRGVLEPTGHFVIYRGDSSSVIFDLATKMQSSSYPGAAAGNGKDFSLEMQVDGNLVVYNSEHNAVYDLGGKVNGVFGPNRWAMLHEDAQFVVGPNQGDWNYKVFYSNATEAISGFELNAIEYITEEARITKIPGDHETLSNVVRNDIKIRKDQSASLTCSFAESRTTGWKTSTTLKIGVKASFQTGIPSIAEGKVETSAEVSQGFEWNESKTTTKTRTIVLPVVVAPGERIIGRAVWSESKISVPYKATGTARFDHDNQRPLPIHIRGVFEGQNVSSVYAEFNLLPLDGPNSLRADKAMLPPGANPLGDDAMLLDSGGWFGRKDFRIQDLG